MGKKEIKSTGEARQDFDYACSILGFTGSIGSGCTFLAEGISADAELHEKVHYYRISAFLREIAKQKGLPETTENLQTLGDSLRVARQPDGKPCYSVLIEKCFERMKKDDDQKHFSYNPQTVILVDGIKNTAEVKWLRQFPNFYLISVHADREERKRRTTGPTAYDKRFENDTEFYQADKKDEEEEIPNGQQIKKCNYLSDIMIINNKDIPATNTKVRKEFFRKFIDDYIYPMSKVRIGEKPYERPPKINETLMTLAYGISKRSSCVKRQVGAVIAYVRTLKQNGQNDEQPDDRDLQFQVISTGYNDIPAGTPCIFTSHQKCHRDYLQEEHAKKYKFCPNCGASIPDEITCPYCQTKNKRSIECQNPQCRADVLSAYKCPKCQKYIFSCYLPGKELSLGKLLDRCRALHAEENAILGLSGISKPVGEKQGELVLYTTTFPCNLCANKIIASGIKKVYYAEPYPIKEAHDLLEQYNVTVERFEGIKSNAYFRLYV